MLKAMHYCHNVIGVVHKDIKPDNIMIGYCQEAILIDFGLAALFTHDANEQEKEALKIKAGTYKFFAPELMTINEGA